jgi:hypothetical protein
MYLLTVYVQHLNILQSRLQKIELFGKLLKNTSKVNGLIRSANLITALVILKDEIGWAQQ